MKQGSHLSCFFKRKKHGAPVRRDFSHMVQKCKRPWQNLVLPRPLFPCPICVLRRPRITKSSGSCSRARQRTCQKRPARLPTFSWAPAHNGRLSAQSRAAANTATGKAPDSHRVPSNPPATQRSGARDDDTMYAFICTKYHAGLQLSMPFSLPAAFSQSSTQKSA